MIEVWVNDTGIGMNEESLCTLRKKVYIIHKFSFMWQMKMKKYQSNL